MPSFLHPIHEVNHCHTKAPGHPCTGYLTGEQARAKKLGIAFDIAPDRNVRLSGFSPDEKRVEIGLEPDDPSIYSDTWNRKRAWQLGRAGILSVARHELGHATDPDYGKTAAQRTIGGQQFSQTYAQELGAWKAAIRDSRGKVEWSTVRKSLTGHLSGDPVFQRQTEALPQAKVDRVYKRTVDRHVALLQRYARRVRRAPKAA